jgi:lipid-A-disaccharide synthase-like uncharacterized protein
MMIFRFFFVISFIFTSGAAAAGDEEFDRHAPAQGEEYSGSEGTEGRFSEILNPSHTCPDCGAVFFEHRSMFMLLIGFLGQLLFTSRFLVQWIASERRRRSYVPIAFWHLSIAGSLLLFAYALSILAWPVILGQAFGILVYSRNLALIAFRRKLEKGG